MNKAGWALIQRRMQQLFLYTLIQNEVRDDFRVRHGDRCDGTTASTTGAIVRSEESTWGIGIGKGCAYDR